MMSKNRHFKLAGLFGAFAFAMPTLAAEQPAAAPLTKLPSHMVIRTTVDANGNESNAEAMILDTQEVREVGDDATAARLNSLAESSPIRIPLDLNTLSEDGMPEQVKQQMEQDLAQEPEQQQGQTQAPKEEKKAAPEEKKAAPEEKKAAPEEKKAAPEEKKTEPQQQGQQQQGQTAGPTQAPKEEKKAPVEQKQAAPGQSVLPGQRLPFSVDAVDRARWGFWLNIGPVGFFGYGARRGYWGYYPYRYGYYGLYHGRRLYPYYYRPYHYYHRPYRYYYYYAPGYYWPAQ